MSINNHKLQLQQQIIQTTPIAWRWRFHIHWTIFSGHYNSWKIQNKLINVVSLESHAQVEYGNGKYFENKRIKLEKTEDEDCVPFCVK